MLVDTEALIPEILKDNELKFSDASYAALGGAVSIDEVVSSEEAA